MSYNVKLDIFEGPLDLLLFFIQRDEINIYDIPISAITREYLEYVAIIQQMKLSIAGEFLEVAAMLMRIKVKMLLPNEKNDEDEIEDPRTELVDMLLEYKKYKLAATDLRSRESTQTGFQKPLVYSEEVEPDYEPDLSELSIYDIGLIFKKVLKNMPDAQKYEIKRVKITITKQVNFITEFMANTNRFSFKKLTEQVSNKIEVIATFLAILEMIKSGLIKVIEDREEQELWIQKA